MIIKRVDGCGLYGAGYWINFDGGINNSESYHRNCKVFGELWTKGYQISPEAINIARTCKDKWKWAWVRNED